MPLGRHAVTLRTARSIAVFLLVLAGPVLAQDAAKAPGEYQPVVGQAGKDVIWVPTPDKVVEKMLSVANVGPDDFVIDLGSGDGRIVVTAAKRYRARGFGVDMNPDMVKLSEARAAREGVSDRAKFHVRDIFQTDLSPATVVTMYLLPDLNLRLRPTILDLKPGTRIVSHAFDMGDWEPELFDTSTGNSVRLWTVPAKAGGTWSLRVGERSGELDVKQQFQKLQGTVRLGGAPIAIRDAKLAGDAIRFVAIELRDTVSVRHEFDGRVSGDAIEGTLRSSTAKDPVRWSATRRAAPRS